MYVSRKPRTNYAGRWWRNFGPHYLRKINDVQTPWTMAQSAARGFSGMVESIRLQKLILEK
jgi:hypothetical protein